MLVWNGVKDKEIEVKASGNMWYHPAFKANAWSSGPLSVTSDLLGTFKR